MLNIMLISLDSKISCPIIMRARGHMIPNIFIYKSTGWVLCFSFNIFWYTCPMSHLGPFEFSEMEIPDP
jgi:hypothetical protein